jgi:GT2 family glycosyltransferase
MNEYPKVSIIILNYNGGQNVIECIESVMNIDYPNYEIIVVDNASTDVSLKNIKIKYSSVKIIENRNNLGVPEGYNVGIRESNAAFLLLLNDDAVVGKNILKDLVNVILADTNIGIVGPTIFYKDKPNVIWSAGGKISPFGYTRHLGKGEYCHSVPKTKSDKEFGRNEDTSFTPVPVDYICGCTTLIRREVIDKIGLLDPEYFAYFEDADYGFRVRKAGFKCLYVQSPTVWHNTIPEWIINPFHAYCYMKNAIVFSKKNLNRWKRLLFIISNIFVLFPYFSIKLAIKNPTLVKHLAKGLRDGMRN